MNEKKLNKKIKKYGNELPTVDGMVEILKSLPGDSVVEITDKMIVHDITDDGKSLSIINRGNCCNNDCEDQVIGNENHDCVTDHYDTHDKVLETYLDGPGEEVKDAIRHTSSDLLYKHPICYPNTSAQLYEVGSCTPLQQDMIDEIREKNAFMAEVLAEQFRRGLAAMFEYNTQCMYRYGRTMCSIVNSDDKDNF